MQRLVKNHTNTVNTARQISYTCTLLVPLHKITIRSNRRAQQQRVLPATVEMDVHREGGRREDDDGDVVVDATRTMRRWKMRMTAPSVYEERQIDASKNTSLLSLRWVSSQSNFNGHMVIDCIVCLIYIHSVYLVRGTQYQHMFVFTQTVHVEIKEGLTAYVKFLLVDLRHVIKIVKKHYKRKLNDFREVFCRCIRYWLVKI